MQKSALVWQKHLLQKNTKQALKSFVPFISLQRMQDAECRHFSAINFSAFHFPAANLPEFRLQTWVAGEARAGPSVVKKYIWLRARPALGALEAIAVLS